MTELQHPQKLTHKCLNKCTQIYSYKTEDTKIIESRVEEQAFFRPHYTKLQLSDYSFVLFWHFLFLHFDLLWPQDTIYSHFCFPILVKLCTHNNKSCRTAQAVSLLLCWNDIHKFKLSKSITHEQIVGKTRAAPLCSHSTANNKLQLHFQQEEASLHVHPTDPLQHRYYKYYKNYK